MFLRLKYLINSKLIDNFWTCSSVQAIKFLPSSKLLSIYPHQFECRQKAKTDEAYQPQIISLARLKR